MQFRKVSLALALLCGATVLLASAAMAAVPSTALIEGTLHSTGGGAAADGDYATVFSIYKDQTGGSPIWFEGPVTVKVAAGQFSYALGTATPLKAADLTAGAWLGMKIGQDPELARKPLHSVAYALRAAVAEGLSCTGCVGADQLDAAVLKDYLKAGDLAAVALSGAYADLSGAPDLTGFVKAANLADVATTGAYADLTGAPDLTVYAKTAGLAKVATTGKYADLAEIPAMAQLGKSCGSNLVVVGIKADGSLDCAQASAAATIAADNIDEISNGLIWNQFTDVFASAAALAIPDNNPIGGYSEIVVGDVGLAQKLTVTLKLTNSDISTVVVTLYDAANQEYVLYSKSGSKGAAIDTVYPDATKTVSGDLSYWVGKNPKGTWRLKVVDGAFLNNTTDGSVSSWSVNLQTLSSKKIRVAGDLVVDGAQTIAGNLTVAGTLTAPGLASPFPVGSKPFLYAWHEDNVENNWNTKPNGVPTYGSSFGTSNDSLHQWGFDTIVYGDKFGNIYKDKGSTGRNAQNASWQALAAFIKNTTSSAINVSVNYWWSTNSNYNNFTGLALNGSDLWTTSGSNISTNTTTVTFPANQTSVLILKSGWYYWTCNGCYTWWGKSTASFYSNSFNLPAGLTFDYDRYNAWIANK
ncbi:MAG: proprotein convertase P-domain-containing protein [Myxococcota bacterium]